MNCPFCITQKREESPALKTRARTKNPAWEKVRFANCQHTLAVAKGSSAQKVTRVAQAEAKAYRARMR